MRPLSFGCLLRGFSLFLGVILALNLSPAQPVARFAHGYTSPNGESHQVAPSAVYLGAYLSDGNFNRSPRSAGALTQALTSSSSTNGLRPREVPPFVNLHPRERVIENYQPPAHARKAAKGRSFLAALRDEIVTFAYGREKALLAPHHVTVDSQGRVIVADPSAAAVHVLDGARSFRIAAGAGRRMRQPTGVAVDGEDNIYVADPDLGLVVVYDRSGYFLRDIGKLGNETLFHAPTGIAIDRKNARLYLLDTPRGVLFMADLAGNILKRVGKGRGHAIGRQAGDAIPLDLNQPTEIALANDRLVMVDSKSSRIRIMDLQCNVLGQFSIRSISGGEPAPEVGLAMDSAGNIYVSNLFESNVRIYDQNGHLSGTFGHAGCMAGEFNVPSGLWIDTDRIYIADTNNRRVQMFQLTPSSPIPLRAAR